MARLTAGQHAANAIRKRIKAIEASIAKLEVEREAALLTLDQVEKPASEITSSEAGHGE